MQPSPVSGIRYETCACTCHEGGQRGAGPVSGADKPPQPPRHCAGCQQTTTEPVLVAIHDQGSGPGGSTYGCLGCVKNGRLAIAPGLLDLAPAGLREAAR